MTGDAETEHRIEDLERRVTDLELWIAQIREIIRRTQQDTRKRRK